MGKKKLPKILAMVTDPTGRRVVILEDVWTKHVLRLHPGMAFERGKVEDTITSPSSVVEEELHNVVSWLYHKRYPLSPPCKYMRVAVRWIPSHGAEGFMTSAYPVPSVKEGKQVWPQL